MELIPCSLLATSSTETPRNAPRSDRCDSFLIKQVLAGRSEHFWELVRPHIPVVSRIVCTRMRNDSEGEDVLQNTLLKAFSRLSQFRFKSSFKTWLTKIAINEARQWHRNPLRSRFSGIEDNGIEEWQVVDDLPLPLEVYERSERANLFHLTLRSLPAKYESVIRLRDLEELSLAETARALRLTIPAVKTRHRRARLLMTRDLAACRRKLSHSAQLKSTE
jgi:RNA polymerase sigma-70 factor, ECF subfamily